MELDNNPTCDRPRPDEYLSTDTCV